MYIESDNIAIFPSQGRSDYYNRKARYLSEANVTVSTSALSSKFGFVVSGVTPYSEGGEQDTHTLTKGTFWIRGYLFSIISDIEIEAAINNEDRLCAVLLTTADGTQVGVADRILNQAQTTAVDAVYQLDTDMLDTSVFCGLQLSVVDKNKWNSLNPQDESCRKENVTYSTSSEQYSKYYLELGVWDDGQWTVPTSSAYGATTEDINKYKLDASAISIKLPLTNENEQNEENHIALQSLENLLAYNYILDDNINPQYARLRIRTVANTDSTQINQTPVARQPIVLQKQGNEYLVIGDGNIAVKNKEPVKVRTIEGWAADYQNGYSLTSATTGHYKVSGENGGLVVEYGTVSDTTTYTIRRGTQEIIKGPSSKSATNWGAAETDRYRVLTPMSIQANAADILKVGDGSNVYFKVNNIGETTVTKLVATDLNVQDGSTVVQSLTATSIESSGVIKGQVGAITNKNSWSNIATNDTFADAFGKIQYAINNSASISGGLVPVTNFAGIVDYPTGQNGWASGNTVTISCLRDLVTVLDNIFKGNCTVAGMMKIQNGVLLG